MSIRNHERTRWIAVAAVAAGAAIAALPEGASAQRLIDRIAAVRDGEVRFQYASRPEVCGDGERFARMGDIFFAGSGRTVVYGRGGEIIRGEESCRQGPAEVRLTMRDGRLVDLRFAVPPTGRGTGRDLGRVATSEARDYFLREIEANDTNEQSRLFMALMLADSVSLWRDFVRIGRDASKSEQLRSKALSWAGHDQDPGAREPLAAIMRDRTQSTKVRQGAAVGLHYLDDADANAVLLDFIQRGDDAKMRSSLIHIIGTDLPNAQTVFRAVARDANAPDEVRGSAFLVLGHTDDPEDGRVLRSLLPSLESTKLAQRLLHAMSERRDLESSRWLIDVAQDTRHPIEVRKQALFWAGQSDLPIAELVAAYDRIAERRLREHAIFVLHQREESQATDKLIAIAQNDPDQQMRKKAIFWLAERKDARSAEFIKRLLQ